jgi:hypothetical protein
MSGLSTETPDHAAIPSQESVPDRRNRPGLQQLSHGRGQGPERRNPHSRALGEKVQLAAGIDEERKLSEESMQRGLDCLKRFAQLINGMPLGAVRIVGTNALREARNRANSSTAPKRYSAIRWKSSPAVKKRA